MHILFITSYYPSPKQPITGIFFHDQASALHRAGHQMGVLVTPRINITVEHARRHGVTALRPVTREPHFTDFPVYKMHLGWFPRPLPPVVDRLTGLFGLQAFRAYCEKHGTPDVIHAQNTFYAGALASRIRQKYDIPFVLTEHSSSFLEGLIIFPGQPAIIRRTLQAAGVRLVVGSSLIAPLNSYLPDVPIEVIGNIVDTDYFTPSDDPLPREPFIFLIIAQLKERRKGFDLLLKAFHEAFGDGKLPVELHIRGSGPLRPELDTLIASLGIGERVEFLPMMSREELRDLIRRSHALVSPSTVETFGVSVAEAMSAGVPVVATRSGGPEDFVTERSGLLVPAGDLSAFANAMQRMVETRATYDPQHVRADVVNRYSEGVYVSRLEKAYQEAIDRRVR
jgi:glycosyltransferase involved in cell wall biosynthesis